MHLSIPPAPLCSGKLPFVKGLLINSTVTIAVAAIMAIMPIAFLYSWLNSFFSGTPEIDNIIKLTEIYHVSADYILLGTEKVSVPVPEKKELSQEYKKAIGIIICK